jgi:hypothetical protein
MSAPAGDDACVGARTALRQDDAGGDRRPAHLPVPPGHRRQGAARRAVLRRRRRHEPAASGLFVNAARSIVEASPLLAEPFAPHDRPGARREQPTVTETELRQPLPVAHPIKARVLTRTHQIAGGLELGRWHVDRLQQPARQQARQLARVPRIRLHPVARPLRAPARAPPPGSRSRARPNSGRDRNRSGQPRNSSALPASDAAAAPPAPSS